MPAWPCRRTGGPCLSMGVDFRDYDNDGRPDHHCHGADRRDVPALQERQGRVLPGRDVRERASARRRIRLSGWGNGVRRLRQRRVQGSVTANSHANDRIEEFESAVYRQPNALFRNVGGKFEDVSATAGEDFRTARANRGVGVADFDRDGRLDAVIRELGERPRLLHNVSAGTNGWLSLRLVGKRSNRDGIGTRIRVGSQSNDMTSSVGYASSSLTACTSVSGRRRPWTAWSSGGRAARRRC